MEYPACYDFEAAETASGIRTLDSAGLVVGLRGLYHSPADRTRVWLPLVAALR